MPTTYFCYICRKPWTASHDPVPPIPTSGKFVAMCLPCWKAQHVKWALKSEDEHDEAFERDAPEDAFGPHCGAGLRKERDERIAFFKAKTEGR